MHVKDIKATVSRVKAVSAGVGGFIGRHKRASIAVGAALLLAGPLVTGDGELVFLNAVGLGLRRAAAQAVRQAQRQAADGTDAAGTTATGDEGATGATGGTSNTTRRRTR